MGNWFDFLAAFDLIDRIEGLISSFLYADWRGAGRKGGAGGIVSEFGRTVTGVNRWRIWVSRQAGWNGADIERFLRKYGVAIWDRGFSGDEYYFTVKRRQANWAEYLLLRRGIPITGPLYNKHNPTYGERYAPGNSPPAWADRGETPREEQRPDAIDRLSDML